MDFSGLPAPLQKELAAVLSDEFCHCGCPHTVGACLRMHTDCSHAKRMTQLALSFIREGAQGGETIVALSKYYQGFRSPRSQFKADPRMCVGPQDARVSVIEFSDFECPHCAFARPILEAFAKKNPKVRFCSLPYPLPGHANALRAAQAALFARDHGKFWQVHDAIFENQMSLSPALLRQLVVDAGLDGAAFDKSVAKEGYMAEIDAFKAAAKTAGVDSTPSIFINGRRLTLPLSEEVLVHAVADEEEWLSNNNAWGKD